MRPGGKPELLCLGHDPVLNRTRRLILQKYFSVRIANALPEAVALLSGQRFDLVLLCYSLTDDEYRAMVEYIHNLRTGTRILALARGEERLPLGPQDEQFEAGGPGELLKKAAEMAGVAVEDRSYLLRENSGQATIRKKY